jgi:hypothetical protein
VRPAGNVYGTLEAKQAGGSFEASAPAIYAVLEYPVTA